MVEVYTYHYFFLIERMTSLVINYVYLHVISLQIKQQHNLQVYLIVNPHVISYR